MKSRNINTGDEFLRQGTTAEAHYFNPFNTNHGKSRQWLYTSLIWQVIPGLGQSVKSMMGYFMVRSQRVKKCCGSSCGITLCL